MKLSLYLCGKIPRHTVARPGDLVRAYKPLRRGVEWSEPLRVAVGEENCQKPFEGSIEA
jgi:hypothetical protein